MFDLKAQPMKTLWKWAEVNSGLTAIWEMPNFPRPKTPYVLLNLLTGPVKLGHDELRHESGDDYLVSGLRRFTLSVSVFGETSMEVAALLQTSLEKPTVLDLLSAVGLAIIDEGDVQDTSTLMETGFERRATLDVSIGYASNETDKVGFIETVEITDGLNDETFTVE